jgi:hypothetical protein
MGNMHALCEREKEEAENKVKYRRMIVVKGNTEYHYNCDTAVYNWYLNRYYPQAHLSFMVIHNIKQNCYGIITEVAEYYNTNK